MSDASNPNPSPSPVITQTSYRETPYRDEAWEVIGERLEATEFESMRMDVLQSAFGVDPMFADYGGIPNTGQAERFHIAEGGTPELGRPKRRAEDRDDENAVPSVPESQVQAMIAEAIEKTRIEVLAEVASEKNSKLEQFEQRIKEIFGDIDTQMKERSAKIELEAVQLSLEISRKIIGTAVDINPEYILPLVRDALQQAGASIVKKVRVSPEDMEFINVIGITKYIKEFDGSWQFEGDSSIKAGCVVETSGGEIDFQLDKAWERIREEALKVLK